MDKGRQDNLIDNNYPNKLHQTIFQQLDFPY